MFTDWGRQEPDTNSPELAAELLERLSKHRTLSMVPLEERQWVVRHGALRSADAGEIIGSKSMGIVPGLVILLTGAVGVYVERDDGQDRVMGWRAGDVTGLLPYSRMTTPPGPTVVEESTEMLFVHRDYLRDLARECHNFTAELVHVMVDRARNFKSKDSREDQDKTLAAGLAHDLKNPASAAARGVKLLGEHLSSLESASRTVGSSGFSEDELAAIESLRATISEPLRRVLSPIEAAQRESDLCDWLEDHGANPLAGDALAETAITIEALEQIASRIDPARFDAAVQWMAEGATVRRLTREIDQAATQISSILQKVTRIDSSAMAGAVSLTECLTESLDMLRDRAQSKSVSVSLNIEQDLPPVVGFGSELGQVWSNLIANAIDAVPQSGRVDISARRERGSVIVRVIDNGPGIPADMRERIFDPFFTTKPVGQGTGLGLGIVKRLVRHNNGILKLDSEPGRTEFQVALQPANAVSIGATP